MPRTGIVPRNDVVLLEVVVKNYLYRFFEDRTMVHKFGPDEAVTPLGLLSSHAYTVHPTVGEPLAHCSCPWMSHNPESRCKHAKLDVACRAPEHFERLKALYVQFGAALDLGPLSTWTPGDPPLPFASS